MVSMLIAEVPDRERAAILASARSQAANLTDENWEWIQCRSSRDLGSAVGSGRARDIVCLDLTMEGMLELTPGLRRACPRAYIILIADSTLSPLTYLRPNISAQALMIKPLDRNQIDRTMYETISSYAEKYLSSRSDLVFAIEYQGEKRFISYDEILYFESREKKIFLYTDREALGFYSTIDQLEEQLSSGFLRVHRSFLVNRRKVAALRLSRQELELAGGCQVPVSRTYKPAIKAFMEKKRQGDARIC